MWFRTKLQHRVVRWRLHSGPMTLECRLRDFADEIIDAGRRCSPRRRSSNRLRHNVRWRSRHDAFAQWLRRARMRSRVDTCLLSPPAGRAVPRNASAVPTHGNPAAMLRRTLSLIPAPKRNGATVRRIRSNTSLSRSTRRGHRRPAAPARGAARRIDRCRRSDIGPPVPARQTSGMISLTSQRAASTLGAKRKRADESEAGSVSKRCLDRRPVARPTGRPELSRRKRCSATARAARPQSPSA